MLERDEAYEMAHDPRSDPEALARLAMEGSWLGDADIAGALARHPGVGESGLDALARSPLADVRRRVARRPDTWEDTLALLACDTDPDVREGVAANPSSTREILADVYTSELRDHRNPAVLQEVASHRNTGPLTLDGLALLDEYEDVTRLVASHPNTSRSTLAHLAESEDADTYWRARENPNRTSEPHTET